MKTGSVDPISIVILWEDETQETDSVDGDELDKIFFFFQITEINTRAIGKKNRIAAEFLIRSRDLFLFVEKSKGDRTTGSWLILGERG